jgi:hypothetical protein
LAAISLSDFRVVEQRISSTSSSFLLVVFSFFLPIVGYMGGTRWEAPLESVRGLFLMGVRLG